MSEASLWLIYATGLIPGFLLRRLRRSPVWVCCAVAGISSLLIVTICAIGDGESFDDKWSALGLWVAFWFGAIAGLIGASVAIWRE